MRDSLVRPFLERASALFAFLEEEHGFRRSEAVVAGHGAFAMVRYDGPATAVEVRLGQGVGVTLHRKRSFADRLLGRRRMIEDRICPLEYLIPLAPGAGAPPASEAELEQGLERYAVALPRQGEHLLAGDVDLREARR